MNDPQLLADRLAAHFGDALSACTVAVGEVTIDVVPDTLVATCTALRDEFGFDTLIDLCGVDYAAYGSSEWETEEVSGSGFSRGREGYADSDCAFKPPARFASVIHLLSVANNERLRVKTWCADNEFPTVDSVTDVWNSANWYERESFDLLGIAYVGHPDLRRLLTDYGFVGHPFRKDFPISGHVEMRYDPEKRRVVYEPVSIEPRVLVPRVIRHDSRYETGAANQADVAEESGDA